MATTKTGSDGDEDDDEDDNDSKADDYDGGDGDDEPFPATEQSVRFMVSFMSPSAISSMLRSRASGKLCSNAMHLLKR